MICIIVKLRLIEGEPINYTEKKLISNCYVTKQKYHRIFNKMSNFGKSEKDEPSVYTRLYDVIVALITIKKKEKSNEV